MDAWGRAEGGGGYGGTGEGQFNWLNTRRGAGANWSQPDFATGVHNTIGALTNGLYNNIVSALRSGRATAPQLATMVAQSPWGTHDGVLRVLGAHPVGFGNAQGPQAPKLGQGFSGRTAGQSLGLAPQPPAVFSASPAVIGALMAGVQNTLAGHPDMSGILALAAQRAQFQAGLAGTVSPGGQSVPHPADIGHGFSGYVNPIPHGSVFERTDQGVDYRTPVGSTIGAIGPSKVVRISNDAGGFGRAIYAQLLSGPHAGKFYYVGHGDPMARVGQILRPGQALARSRAVPYGNAAGTPGHIEMGWAGSPYGPLGALGSSNVGNDFLNFLRSLGG